MLQAEVLSTPIVFSSQSLVSSQIVLQKCQHGTSNCPDRQVSMLQMQDTAGTRAGRGKRKPALEAIAEVRPWLACPLLHSAACVAYERQSECVLQISMACMEEHKLQRLT